MQCSLDPVETIDPCRPTARTSAAGLRWDLRMPVEKDGVEGPRHGRAMCPVARPLLSDGLRACQQPCLQQEPILTLELAELALPRRQKPGPVDED